MQYAYATKQEISIGIDRGRGVKMQTVRGKKIGIPRTVLLHVVVAHLFGFCRTYKIAPPLSALLFEWVPFGSILIKCKLYSTPSHSCPLAIDKRMGLRALQRHSRCLLLDIMDSYHRHRKYFMNPSEYNCQTNCLFSYSTINFIATLFVCGSHLHIQYKSNINTKFRLFCSSGKAEYATDVCLSQGFFSLSLSRALLYIFPHSPYNAGCTFLQWMNTLNE